MVSDRNGQQKCRKCACFKRGQATKPGKFAQGDGRVKAHTNKSVIFPKAGRGRWAESEATSDSIEEATRLSKTCAVWFAHHKGGEQFLKV